MEMKIYFSNFQLQAALVIRGLGICGFDYPWIVKWAKTVDNEGKFVKLWCQGLKWCISNSWAMKRNELHLHLKSYHSNNLQLYNPHGKIDLWPKSDQSSN